MKKYSILIIVISMTILLLFSSCGVIIDPLRVVGKWKLISVEYYVYNPVIHTTKTYKGINKDDPSSENPIMGEYFEAGKDSYTIEFDVDNTFLIYTANGDATDDVLVDSDKSYWEVNTFENSLFIKVDRNRSATDPVAGFWKDGFSLKNYWPMANYQTLELVINAGDVGKSSFKIDLSNKELRAQSMKGIFEKQ